jgi:hypothetical protein
MRVRVSFPWVMIPIIGMVVGPGGCKHSTSGPASSAADPSPSERTVGSLVSGGQLVYDQAVSNFFPEDFEEFDLTGVWSVEMGPTKQPGHRFSVVEDRLVLDGPLGRFVGGRALEAPDVIVLVYESAGPGPPFVVIQSLIADGQGRFRGMDQTRGGDEESPRPIVWSRAR